MKEVRDMMGTLKDYGVECSALVSKDGTLLVSDMPRDSNAETFGIMMATMLGAAMTACSEMKLNKPVTVLADSKDSKICIRTAEGKFFIAFVLKKGAQEKKIEKLCNEILANYGTA